VRAARRPVLFDPGEHPNDMASKSIRFGYAGIRVRDLKKSLRFYRGLGFLVRKRGKMAHGGEWVHLTLPRSPQRLELNYYPKGNRFFEPFKAGTELDHLGFFVKDLPFWVKRAERLGGKIVAVVDEPHEHLAYVTDPDGVWVEFCESPWVPPDKRPST
jgi:catechol 2,3-dioxygenase-like lactoylglutathione lyase family enzyme